ncbi:MAG: helix-turn-helix domain-containing protein [Pseudonocardiaceae bacterium]
MILSEDTSQGKMSGLNAEGVVLNPSRRWSLRDRYSPEDLQTMIGLYRSGSTARQVAEAFGIGLTSMKRVLREHGVRREGHAAHVQCTDGQQR